MRLDHRYALSFNQAILPASLVIDEYVPTQEQTKPTLITNMQLAIWKRMSRIDLVMERVTI